MGNENSDNTLAFSLVSHTVSLRTHTVALDSGFC